MRTRGHDSDQRPPLPTTADGFMGLVESGWDAEVARRPHGQRTTVVMHLDVKDAIAPLHLGPLLSDADRRYLTCDATCEASFQRDGQPIGAGHTTRRSAGDCVASSSTATRPARCPARGNPRSARPSHPTLGTRRPHRLNNLVLLCPYHHRLHHRGTITITGPQTASPSSTATAIMSPGALARPPNPPPPDVPPIRALPANTPNGSGTTPSTPTTTEQKLAPVPGPALK